MLRASAVDKQLLQRYTQGVNQGLSALTLPAFEYALLQQTPQMWRAEDSILVIFSMYLDLQESDSNDDHKLTQLRKLLPKDLFTFLTAFHSPWHASLDDALVPAPVFPSSAWPVPEHRNSNKLNTSSIRADARQDYHYGSNNWAISSALTPYKSAMLANDMHLELMCQISGFALQCTGNHRRYRVTRYYLTWSTWPDCWQ